MILNNDNCVIPDQESVLVLCAHSDDQIFGPGGTIAKYAKEGKKVYSVIFSFGESSHPHMKDNHTAAMRLDESYKADKLVGGSGIQFLGLKETHFFDHEAETKEKLKQIIEDKRPSVIFTHSDEDMHPDHRAVCKLVIDSLNEMDYKCDVYAFDVWVFFNFKKTQSAPRMYVDITKTFSLKIKALRAFKSQMAVLIVLLWSVYLRAFVHGLSHKGLFVERFFKLK